MGRALNIFLIFDVFNLLELAVQTMHIHCESCITSDADFFVITLACWDRFKYFSEYFLHFDMNCGLRKKLLYDLPPQLKSVVKNECSTVQLTTSATKKSSDSNH